MDIGPISAIRPVSMVRSQSAAPDLAGVFRVEFQREQDERYTPSQQKASRGLEDEDNEIEDGELEFDDELEMSAEDGAEDMYPRMEPPVEGGRLSFFA